MSDTKFKPNIRNFDSFNNVIKHFREESGINPGKLADILMFIAIVRQITSVLVIPIWTTLFHSAISPKHSFGTW